MKNRTIKGAGLALAAGLGFILVAVGAAIYFLIQLFGAGTEAHNAVDSGSLNVAKQAAITPSVPLPGNTAIAKAFQGLVDPQTSGVDLLTYNRLVGQALLVSLNAEADGNSQAIQDAQAAVAFVEGTDPASMGSQLRNAFVDPTSNNNWAQTYFNQAAQRNSLFLSENKGNIQWRQEDYAVSYLGQDLKGDNGTSNISLGANLNQQLPFSDYQQGSQVSFPGNGVDGTGKFLRGYQELKIDGIGSIFAVALSPEQPHLVSRDRFVKQSAQPGANTVVIPPNTFYHGGQIFDGKSKSQIIVNAAATVGTAPFAQSPYPLAIPNGYLIIDNSGTASYSGSLPNPDNVAANELGTGIQVDPSSGCFSDNGAVEAWENYNQQVSKGTTGLTPPGLSGLYTAGGSPATAADAAKIGQGPAITCTDLNSDATNPGACQACIQHMTPAPGQTLGPFDLAYHPNGGYSLPNSGNNTLTSGEAAKMEVMSLYSQGPSSAAVLTLPGTATGMRLYPSYNSPVNGTPIPWGPTGAGFNQHQYPNAALYSDPKVPGKVTTDGSILQLISQTTGSLPYTSTVGGSSNVVSTAPAAGQSAADELRRFITNRIYQIKPSASQAEIDAVLNQPIALGSIYYVYQDSSQNIVISTTPPLTLAAMGAQGTTPDGTAHSFSKSFNIVDTVANPHYEFNIHDQPFTQVSAGNATETLTTTYTPASGAYNLLGVVKFQDLASNQGPPPVLSERD